MIKHLRPRAATLLSTKLRKSTLQLEDSEFGCVVCKRSRTSRYVRLRIAQDGTLRATLPPGGTLRHVQQLIDESRVELRKLIGEQSLHKALYVNGQPIGQSHRLEVIEGLTSSSHTIHQQKIIVSLAAGVDSTSTTAQTLIKLAVKTALRREAKAYLPRRLAYLAQQHGFRYTKTRFANQSGRWGSCSSSGTISLNIALMNLPLELVDYVIIHELCHTVHLNHQPDFWNLVEQHSPSYRTLRKALKQHNPHL